MKISPTKIWSHTVCDECDHLDAFSQSVVNNSFTTFAIYSQFMY